MTLEYQNAPTEARKSPKTLTLYLVVTIRLLSSFVPKGELWKFTNVFYLWILVEDRLKVSSEPLKFLAKIDKPKTLPAPRSIFRRARRANEITFSVLVMITITTKANSSNWQINFDPPSPVFTATKRNFISDFAELGFEIFRKGLSIGGRVTNLLIFAIQDRPLRCSNLEESGHADLLR